MTIKGHIGLLGILVTAIGVLMGFANLQGWFAHSDRRDVLAWTLATGGSGLRLEDPRAIAFSQRFPPPKTAKRIIAIAKNAMRVGDGPVFTATVGYVTEDGERLFVATLDDVRAWSAETRYPWVAWLFTTFGLLVTISMFILNWRETRHKLGADQPGIARDATATQPKDASEEDRGETE
jgi:hypothetical protein